MNETITLPRLAELMANMLPGQYEETEKFIKAFFSHLEDSLVVSEKVDIDGFGSFTRTSDPGNPIVFQPAPAIAEALNQPFEMFEPVAVGNADISSNAEIPEKEIEPEVSPVLPPPITETPDIIEKETPQEKSDDEPVPLAPIATPQPVNEPDDLTVASDEKRPRIAVWIIIAFILGMMIGAAISYYYYEGIRSILSPATLESAIDIQPDEPITIEQQQITEDIETGTLIEPVDSTPMISPEIKEENIEVYDTVTPQRFLTTMARQYYGQMEYWVFIYEANANVLGNPNRIKPGTRVLIPDKNKFTDGETPEQTLARAKRMSKDIYERY